jgi:hypothetical protein
MDKAIAKVNQNELYMRSFSTQVMLYLKTTAYSLTSHSYVKFKLKMVFTCACVNFIKTISESFTQWCNRPYEESSIYFNYIRWQYRSLRHWSRDNTFKICSPWHAWTSNFFFLQVIFSDNLPRDKQNISVFPYPWCSTLELAHTWRQG